MIPPRRVILITGAGSGLGAGLASILARARHTVLAADAAVDYLISPLARNVTGQTITIDGGWTAQ